MEHHLSLRADETVAFNAHAVLANKIIQSVAVFFFCVFAPALHFKNSKKIYLNKWNLFKRSRPKWWWKLLLPEKRKSKEEPFKRQACWAHESRICSVAVRYSTKEVISQRERAKWAFVMWMIRILYRTLNCKRKILLLFNLCLNWVGERERKAESAAGRRINAE